MKKILSLTLAAMMVVSVLPVAYAADVDYKTGTNVTVVGDGGEYFVTVPASLEPGQTGTVTAYGKWASNATVKVWTEDTVEVTHVDTGAKTDVNVTFAGIESAGNDVEDMNVTAPISIDKGEIRFGEWKGLIEYNVEYEKEPEYVITSDSAYWKITIDPETQVVNLYNSTWAGINTSGMDIAASLTYNGSAIDVNTIEDYEYSFAFQGDGDYAFTTIITTSAGTGDPTTVNFNIVTE